MRIGSLSQVKIQFLKSVEWEHWEFVFCISVVSPGKTKAVCPSRSAMIVHPLTFFDYSLKINQVKPFSISWYLCRFQYLGIVVTSLAKASPLTILHRLLVHRFHLLGINYGKVHSDQSQRHLMQWTFCRRGHLVGHMNKIWSKTKSYSYFWPGGLSDLTWWGG